VNSPTAVATDGTHLVVADTANGRVLIWNTVPSGVNAAPDVVLGQKDFTSLQDPSAVSASNLRAPQGVWIQSGKLFVADTGNNRVLIWNSIPTQNGQAADLVLGQPNMSSNSAPPVSTTSNPTAAANVLWNPISVTVSQDGAHLFVADFGYNRLLIWNSIPTQNQQAADVEIGQVDMTGSTSNDSSHLCASTGTDSNNNPTYPARCEKTLSHPRFAISDGTRLFVADTGNDRVLVYNQIPTSNATAANLVLGQPDFVTNVIAPNTSIITSFVSNIGGTDTTPTPLSLAFDGTNLYVSDPSDQRVLVFSPADIPVTGKQVLNNASKIIRQEGLIVLAGTAVAKDTVTVTVSGTSYTYTVADGDTLDKVTTGVINAINSSNSNAGDPNVQAVQASVADTILLLAKSGTADLNTIAYSVTTSNSTDITGAAAGTYLAGGNSGTLAPGALFEVDNPNVDANGNVTSAALALADFTKVADTTKTLPTVMAGPSGTASNVEVYVDGFAVPILSVSPTQIIAQIPYSFVDSTTHAVDRNSLSVYVRTKRSDGTVLTTSAAPAAFTDANPGLFASASSTEPRPALGAMHQSGNPSVTVSIEGSVTVGDKVAISVNSTSYSYTAVSTDSLNSIAIALANAINTANDPNVTAVSSASGTVTLLAKKSGSAGTGIPVSTSVTAATSGGTATETVVTTSSSTCCSTNGSGAVTIFNPAQASEVITFLATGLGNVQDQSGNVITIPVGVPYAGTQPNSVTNLVNATVNGTGATVLDAGLANGTIGVYQVQVQMPSTLPSSGITSVYIAQNAFISNTVTLPVGTATTHTMVAIIDTPRPGQTLDAATFTAAGWAGDPNSNVTSISVYIDGFLYGTPTHFARPDVCAVRTIKDCPGNPGWTINIDGSKLARGSHTMLVTALGSDGDSASASITFTIARNLQLTIDAPQSNATASGNLTFYGWAVSTTSVPENTVTYRIDGGSPLSTTSFARPDVCAAYPNSYDCAHGNNNVGFQSTIDTTQLGNGPHVLAVEATDSAGAHRTGSVVFTTNNTAANLKENIDVPNGEGATLVGTVSLYGWATGPTSTPSRVAIWIDGQFLGNASFMARGDVCAAFPSYAGCPSGDGIGWTLPLDTTTLTNGKHVLQVTAFTNGGSLSSTRSFNVANWTTTSPMRVFIDSPARGATVSGALSMFGWAISDQSSITSVKVAVDGIAAAATYGANRSDVCGAYPGRAGCPNVGWNSQLDTTTLTNGTHVVTLTATAGNGQVYTVANTFTIANTNNAITMYIDNSLSSPLTSVVQLAGWAGSASGQVSKITLSLDGSPIGQTTETVARPDVCAAYPTYVGCPGGDLGWTFPFDPTLYAPGAHTLSATATTGSVTRTIYRTIVIGAASSSALRIFVDNPPSAATLVGTAALRGWASDGNGTLDSVAFAVDGVPITLAVTYGPRGDVCSALKYSGTCANVGWSTLLDTTNLADGAHTLSITAASGSQHATIAWPFTVANWTSFNPVQVVIENPVADTAPFAGQAVLSGYAFSQQGTVDSVIVSVDNYIVAQPAVYGEARTDVCASLSAYNCPNVGWSFNLDTTQIPDGVHTLNVTATVQQGGPLSPTMEQSTISTTFTIQNYTN
jgi:uncharacterized protein (TIGR03437 family)